MCVIDGHKVDPQPAIPAAVNPIEAVGRSSPLGATIFLGGVNFSLFSRSALAVELLLFDREDDARPARTIRINPAANRTYHYWHVFVPDVQPGQLYGYRVQGPSDPANGLRFDSSKVLLDPYGRGVVVPKNYSRQAASYEGDNTANAMKSVVVDPRAYDWEGDKPVPCQNLIRTNSLAFLSARDSPPSWRRHKPGRPQSRDDAVVAASCQEMTVKMNASMAAILRLAEMNR